jgi:hypothetical protein
LIPLPFGKQVIKRLSESPSVFLSPTKDTFAGTPREW